MEIVDIQECELIPGSELTENELREFDYIDNEDELLYSPRFFRYKGEVYDIGDMMRTDYQHKHSELKQLGWDAIQGFTAWTGIVIAVNRSGDGVRCGYYIA